MGRLSAVTKICGSRAHLARTSGIALVVGTWLTLFNHVTALTGVELVMWVRVVLNYVTPLVVANWGLISRQREAETSEDDETVRP